MVEIRKYSVKCKKINLRVVIFTPEMKISGTLHLMGGRLTDFLNNKGASEAELFIPITDASIYAKDSDTLLYYTKYLGINKQHITFIFPLDEDDSDLGDDLKGRDEENGK